MSVALKLNSDACGIGSKPEEQSWLGTAMTQRWPIYRGKPRLSLS